MEEKRLRACPRCGGVLQDGVERRQQFKSGFRTKRDAQRALNEALRAVDEGSHIAVKRQTVGEYLIDEWLLSRQEGDRGGRRHRGRLSSGTWAAYRADLEAYVLPRIGGVRLQALTPGDLNRLYDELEERGGRLQQGLSPKTVANVHGILHKAFTDAVRQGRLSRNPAEAVDPPKAQRARTNVWTVEQLRRFLQHVADERLYAAWLLFATTGMRRGEVAGLSWADVDLDEGRLRIDWTLGVVSNEPTWKPRAKSDAGERLLSLDPATVDALRKHRRRQQQERLSVGAAWERRQADSSGRSRTDVVFTWPDGRLINPERWTYWFANYVRAAGLPRIRLHDVRHTYATAALVNATGWHEVKVISERLGHASIGITLDTYAHVLPAVDAQASRTLARVILGQ